MLKKQIIIYYSIQLFNYSSLHQFSVSSLPIVFCLEFQVNMDQDKNDQLGLMIMSGAAKVKRTHFNITLASRATTQLVALAAQLVLYWSGHMHLQYNYCASNSKLTLEISKLQWLYRKTLSCFAAVCVVCRDMHTQLAASICHDLTEVTLDNTEYFNLFYPQPLSSAQPCKNQNTARFLTFLMAKKISCHPCYFYYL